MAGAYDADPVFQANPQHLDYLLQRINSGAVAIPDFQRDFTWEPRRTAALLRSMMSRFPAGTFLFWAVGGDNSKFGWRPVEGAPERSVDPQELILDGQQRLTCLYRALNGLGEERFYLSLAAFLHQESGTGGGRKLRRPQEVDFDEAVFWHPAASKEARELVERGVQIERHILPVHEHRRFDEWLDDYAAAHAASVDEKSTKALLRELRDAYLVPLRSYGFPVVTLPSETSIEAVATVFETLNSTGKPLGPFELLTARLYPSGVHLRDLWDRARSEFEVLDEYRVDPYSVLQSVTLRVYGSAQRSDVLRRLTAADVEAHWDYVVRGFARVIELLQAECGVVTPGILPYSVLLVPLAAIWNEVSKAKGPEKSNVLLRVMQFFWCTVFTTNYDQGANSQAGADFGKLRYWLFDPSKEAPEAVAHFSLLDTTLRTATTRRKALYAGILALSVKAGARDFHTGMKLTPERVRSDKIDSHHVFPKGFLAAARGSEVTSELALNRALIDPVTNKVIGSQAPSEYFAELRLTLGHDKLVEIMESHLIDASDEDDPIRADDYEGFIDRRLADVVSAIELATGRSVTRQLPPEG